MDDNESLIYSGNRSNRLFGNPQVLDRNLDNIIVNERGSIPLKPPDR